ncbi:serine/threonine-protein kinase [Chondromyces apiculatus]|uniref:Serine/threonine-protein kinase pkn3 n=1 Tax=Chondromyces apiculatus DSM 436 TaxID=1192034 RepID=A0A017T9C5_9BACT|nr:serine/threonine-protein kinase [Chondromyces apiculatus]EYF05844.1 Serine/threonine-protein kinase pkn3 [Chondromyces apiculatus DSM 436]
MNPGDLIQSRYRLGRLLGAGASGSVWAAKNELIDRDVALKVMSPEVAEDAVALQRFFNEARASGRVRSPSIVEILDLGQAENGSPFLVFELLSGQGLDQKLLQEGILSPETLLEIFIGITRALDLAHQQNIVHRDLKPANLYVHRTAHGELVGKILDFGISKIFDTSQNFTLTRTGCVVGSPAYMSPEQASGREDLDGRADIWSIGVVMYEALTGTLPHQAPNYNALMVRILTQDCDPVMTRKPDLPPNLCAVVDGCLKRDREARIASAGVLANQLESVLRELRNARYRAEGGRRSSDRSASTSIAPPGEARAARSASRQRRRTRTALILIAAGIGLGVGLSVLVVLSMTWLR